MFLNVFLHTKLFIQQVCQFKEQLYASLSYQFYNVCNIEYGILLKLLHPILKQ